MVKELKDLAEICGKGVDGLKKKIGPGAQVLVIVADVDGSRYAWSSSFHGNPLAILGMIRMVEASIISPKPPPAPAARGPVPG